ncbi:MAG: HDOD domain-containing protein [Nitrospina sp.]|jgi:HD-like signal output (HDOD) protein|nr:HDOD domain-containing protein [Nitrospina sp.]MBT5632583.1 HDOD domain-containing protein [Nitrospina sp.]
MNNRRKILFVDDDPAILQSMRRATRQMRDEWDCQYANGGKEALELQEKETVDLIISDMRMPEMDGAELLKETRKRYPKTIRFILSGQSEDDTFLRALGSTHQFISKPCNFEELKDSIHRSFHLRDEITKNNLEELVLGIDSIPSIPEIYFELVEEIESPDCSLESVVKIVSKDVAMTAKILQVSNSAFFGYSNNISDIGQAVQILGLDMVRTLTLSINVFSTYEDTASKVNFERIWEHSLQVSVMALALAKLENCSKEVQSFTFTAGMLHDIGHWIIVLNLPEKYAEIRALQKEKNLCISEAEKKVLQFTHSTLGSYLVNLWGLPDPIVEAIAYHHCPSLCQQREILPLTFVHVASCFDNNFRSEIEFEDSQGLDGQYIKELGLSDRISEWRQSINKLKDDSDE